MFQEDGICSGYAFVHFQSNLDGTNAALDCARAFRHETVVGGVAYSCHVSKNLIKSTGAASYQAEKKEHRSIPLDMPSQHVRNESLQNCTTDVCGGTSEVVVSSPHTTGFKVSPQPNAFEPINGNMFAMANPQYIDGATGD